jgi:hypothetical protein
MVFHNAEVHQVLNSFTLRLAKRCKVREVKAQSLSCNQRALLRHVFTQCHAQRPVQEVGRRVVASDGITVCRVHLQIQRIAHLHLPRLELRQVNRESRNRSLRVENSYAARRA